VAEGLEGIDGQGGATHLSPALPSPSRGRRRRRVHRGRRVQLVWIVFRNVSAGNVSSGATWQTVHDSPRRERCANNVPRPRRCQTSTLLLADVAEARGVCDARDGRGKPLGGCCE
jgi:hypothetical protein